MDEKKIDRRELDAALMDMVRGDRRRKRPVVSHKPPKKEIGTDAAMLAKKPA